MKRILITGANSYIGTSFEKWVRQWPNDYQICTVDTKKDWTETSFNTFDIVFHVAAIVHKNEKKQKTETYYRVNCDLAYEVALKAKQEGVSQFVFLSTMGVYGKYKGNINSQTKPNPKTHYAKSKLMAEDKIKSLENKKFKVTILRPPLVYGKNCKGNYTRLSRLALKTPIFPKIKNQRSMIHIDNLCEFIKLLIDEQEQGIFFPQNSAYVNSADLVMNIAKVHHKKIHLTSFLNPLINQLTKHMVIFQKVFGSLVYDQNLSHYKKDYNVVSFKKSIELTEK